MVRFSAADAKANLNMNEWKAYNILLQMFICSIDVVDQIKYVSK